jgi:hypothetical protein
MTLDTNICLEGFSANLKEVTIVSSYHIYMALWVRPKLRNISCHSGMFMEGCSALLGYDLALGKGGRRCATGASDRDAHMHNQAQSN